MGFPTKGIKGLIDRGVVGAFRALEDLTRLEGKLASSLAEGIQKTIKRTGQRLLPMTGASAAERGVIQALLKNNPGLQIGIRAGDPITALITRVASDRGLYGKAGHIKSKSYFGVLRDPDHGWLIRSDLDIAWVTKGKIPLTNQQVLDQVVDPLNRELAKLGRLPSFFHGAHFAAIRHFGGPLDFKTYVKIASPGPVTVFTGDAMKTLRVHEVFKFARETGRIWPWDWGVHPIGTRALLTANEPPNGSTLTATPLGDAWLLASAAKELWERLIGAPFALPIYLSFDELPGAQLAETRFLRQSHQGSPAFAAIAIDPDAAGVGWFIDSTPFNHSEFGQILGVDTLLASADSPATLRYDLFTALVHEFAHLLGFISGYPDFDRFVSETDGRKQFISAPNVSAFLSLDGEHLDRSLYPFDLMNGLLEPGVRKLPSTLDIAIIRAIRGLPPAGEDDAADATSIDDAEVVVTAALEAAPQCPATGGAIVNSAFCISDPADSGFGWNVRGSASITEGEALLAENEQVFTRFSQSFIVPDEATALRFKIVNAQFGTNGASQPDTFEVALLDAHTMISLVSTATGLTDTDAILNIQQTGEVFFGSDVTVPGVSTSGQAASLNFPLVVTVDLRGVAAGTEATLYFDLLGFAPTGSSVTIDDVVLVDATTLPPLEATLDGGSDSGLAGDNITNISIVSLAGTTNSNQLVLLDIDNDGFDDGSATAGSDGRFTLANVTLAEGPNVIRLQAPNGDSTSEFSRTITLDRTPPQPRFLAPTTVAIFEEDLGYLEMNWDDLPAGVLSSSLDTGDIQIQGVTIDDVEMLVDGRVRYWFNRDGDRLRMGTTVVTVFADQVVDQAGNAIAASSAALRRLRLTCAWNNLLERYDSNNDGFVTPQDALVTINQLNSRTLIDESGKLPTTGVADTVPPPFYDVNCDNFGTPQDVLVVINELNRRSMSGEGEAESADSDLDSARTEQVVDLAHQRNRGVFSPETPLLLEDLISEIQDCADAARFFSGPELADDSSRRPLLAAVLGTSKVSDLSGLDHLCTDPTSTSDEQESSRDQTFAELEDALDWWLP